MVGTVARDEAPKESRLDAHLAPNLAARPDLDALSMLCGEHHLLADPLLFLLVAREVEPAARREIAGDALAHHDPLEQFAIAQRDPEHQRRLAFALGAKDFF